VFALDVKITAAGGKRYVPINLEVSQMLGREIRDGSRAYENKYADYFRIDIKPSYRVNLKKCTLEWNCDFQNITRHDNIFQEIYDVNSKTIRKEYQLKFFFIPQFRMLF
jgi:hypothetical protein